MSSPSIRIRPLSGAISRLIIRSVVVLPQPDGPMSTHVWPPGMSRVRSLTALEPRANSLLTFSNRITASFTVIECRRANSSAIDPWVNWDWLSTHVPLFEDALSAAPHADRDCGCSAAW